MHRMGVNLSKLTSETALNVVTNKDRYAWLPKLPTNQLIDLVFSRMFYYYRIMIYFHDVTREFKFLKDIDLSVE